VVREGGRREREREGGRRKGKKDICGGIHAFARNRESGRRDKDLSPFLFLSLPLPSPFLFLVLRLLLFLLAFASTVRRTIALAGPI